MSKWCVVATRQARERLASTQLKNQNFSAYFPEISKTSLKGGRHIVHRRPLFPGYVFVEYESEVGRWRSINGTLGVKYLLMQNEKPSLLPEGFIELLRGNMNEDGTIAQYRFLMAGDNAAIVTGPFANQVGKLLSVDDKGRVAILLELLSSKRPVKTRIENLMPA